MMLAMTVLAVASIAYGLGALEDWGRALAVGLAAGLPLTSSWILVWVLRQNEERLRARALNDSLPPCRTGLRSWNAWIVP